MTKLFAQPYDISARGFYFDTVEEYAHKAGKLKNDYGQAVEEFEIQFIDGEGIDCKLFSALGIHQGNIDGYLKAVEEWDEGDKINVIIAVGEGGYSFDINNDDPGKLDVELYAFDTLQELAEYFVAEGLFGEIPESIQAYLDYNAIGRDLGMDYGQTNIDGTNYLYRCD